MTSSGAHSAGLSARFMPRTPASSRPGQQRRFVSARSAAGPRRPAPAVPAPPPAFRMFSAMPEESWRSRRASLKNTVLLSLRSPAEASAKRYSCCSLAPVRPCLAQGRNEDVSTDSEDAGWAGAGSVDEHRLWPPRHSPKRSPRRPRSRPPAAPPRLRRSRLSSTARCRRAEVDRYLAIFNKDGAAALRKALAGAPATGSVRLAGGPATPTRLTLERPTDKGRLLTIVTDEPVAFLGAGVPGAKPREGYDFAIIDLALDKAGSGSGTFAPAAKVTALRGAFAVGRLQRRDPESDGCQAANDGWHGRHRRPRSRPVKRPVRAAVRNAASSMLWRGTEQRC